VVETAPNRRAKTCPDLRRYVGVSAPHKILASLSGAAVKALTLSQRGLSALGRSSLPHPPNASSRPIVGAENVLQAGNKRRDTWARINTNETDVHGSLVWEETPLKTSICSVRVLSVLAFGAASRSPLGRGCAGKKEADGVVGDGLSTSPRTMRWFEAIKKSKAKTASRSEFSRTMPYRT